MALNSSTYYSNAIQGIPGAGVDVDIHRVDTVPKYPVGHMLERADGNIYRYCHIGATNNAGILVGPGTSGQATYNAAIIVAPASAQTVPAEPNINAGAVGSHYIEVTIAGIAANKYQGGYLITTGGTGIGETYRIVGNTATGTPVTGNLRIQLADAVKTAFTASTGLIIQQSMFTDLTVCPTTNAIVTGVLMSKTTVADSWAWVCTKGVVGCQEDGTFTVSSGQQVIASGNTAGAYGPVGSSPSTLATNAFQAPIIGFSLTASGDTSKANRQGVIFIEME